MNEDNDIFSDVDNVSVFDGDVDTGYIDLEEVTEVSVTDSLTVTDTSVTCTYDDTVLVEKLDIIIMLLIVIIAIRMFSPLANTHKRILEKKEK